jgi:hypothetical protein
MERGSGGREFLWWGSGDLNPDALRHKILSLARLPIPTLPLHGYFTIGRTQSQTIIM